MAKGWWRSGLSYERAARPAFFEGIGLWLRCGKELGSDFRRRTFRGRVFCVGGVQDGSFMGSATGYARRVDRKRAKLMECDEEVGLESPGWEGRDGAMLGC